MGPRTLYVEAALPSGAHRVTIDEEVVLTPRIVIAPQLPPGALAVTIDGVTLLPDTRLAKPLRRSRR